MRWRHLREPNIGTAIALSVLLIACGGASQRDRQSSEIPSATATPDPAPSASPNGAPAPSGSAGTAPISAGAVPDAGVLFVQGADDQIYRYEGRTGTLEPVWGKSTFDLEHPSGAYVVGRHGGAALLGWDGSTTELPCGPGVGARVSPSGGCASAGPDGLFVKLREEVAARQVLPADWAVGGLPAWSPDGRRLLLVRGVEPRPGPGMDPGLAALWLMEPDGRLREVYRPPERGVLTAPSWSPDGTKALVRQYETTSNSFAADGAGVSTLVVDLVSGRVRSLGPVMGSAWATWAPDGRLAYVRGGGRMTWEGKELRVIAPDGRETSIEGDSKRVALAPAWGPSGQLAWVSGPATADFSGYMDGVGAGARLGRVAVAVARRDVGCGEGRVVEGLRWAADASTLLLLCRKVGKDLLPLELWLHRLADGTSAPLVRGLMSGVAGAGGFGYYGLQPSITSVAAWSLGMRN